MNHEDRVPDPAKVNECQTRFIQLAGEFGYTLRLWIRQHAKGEKVDGD